MSRRIIILILLIAAAFAGGHWLTLEAIPRMIMAEAMERFERGAGGVNAALHPPPPSPERRGVVRPNPHFLYAICPIDLSDGPVRVTATPTQDYWSISFYSARTDVFHVESGSRDRIEILASTSDQGDAIDSIAAPTMRAVALMRLFIADQDDIPRLRQTQRGFECEATATEQASTGQPTTASAASSTSE